jgi:ubiquinone/menaquinone biosynthesis C-methylase UbiE
MNIVHRWYCKSDAWAKQLTRGLTYATKELDLGDNLLEIGPGPGVGTDWFKERVAHMTAVEIDHKLARSLKQRMEGTNVRVVEGDATDMDFNDNTFSSAASFTMLHHVPSSELQDKLFAEAFRVLEPGAPFFGSDSVPSLRWNIFHLFDTRVPVNPDTVGSRLEAAGFTSVSVTRFPGGFGFSARKPS